MKFISISGMNNLVAYGAPDGNYYTVDEYKGKADMYVIARVRNGNVTVNGFEEKPEAMNGWRN